MVTNGGVLGGRNHLDLLVIFNDELLRIHRKFEVNSGKCFICSNELEADFTVGDGGGSDSSLSGRVTSVESQFGSSNRSTYLDRKTGLVLLLEVWLGNGLVVLGVGAVGTLVILIMSS